MALGKIIFYNHASLALDYFDKIGYPCPDMTNPADYFMSIMSIETAEEEAEFENTNQLFSNQFQGAFEKFRKKVEYFHNSY